ncbi:MAG: helix-turn-helix domain-containing protein [Duncaniella sp.]|nr:helix-turn-helix domain-containing protein [Duncaniella sp.]
MISRLLLILILWLVPSGAAAEFFCRKYNFATGESALENHISNVQQDESGFLWFATWNGLVRYDGYNFHAFQPILSSDGQILSNRIYNIRVASTGDLWCVSSDNLLFLFSRRDMRFLNLHALIPEIADKRVRVITPLRNGATWITFRDETALRLDDASPVGSYRLLDHDDKALDGSRRINGVVLTDCGEEWLLTDLMANNLSRGYSVAGNFSNVYSVNGCNFLIGNDGTIVRIKPDGSSPVVFPLSDGSKVKINYTLYVDGRIIIATDQGVKGFNTADGSLMNYTDIPAGYLFKDSRQRVWCPGGDNATVLIRDVSQPYAEKLESPVKGETVSPLKNPRLIFEHTDGVIVLLPAGGVLSYFDEESGRLLECVFLDGDTRRTTYSPSGIKKFLVDDDSNLWVFHESGADCISFRRKYFDRHENFGSQETRAVAEDAAGRLWIGDRSNRLRVTDRDFNTLFYLGGDGRRSLSPIQFAAQPVYAIEMSTDGSAWIGTKGDGLYHIELSKQSARHYSAGSDDPSLQIPTDTIYDILFSGDRMWLGSYGNGLITGMPDGDGKYRFTYVNGQPQGMKIRSIFDAGKDRLILGTADGLVTADVSDLRAPRFHINRYRSDDRGLKGNDVMSVVEYGGKIYACVFGSGLSRIDSEDILSDSLLFTNFIIPSSASAGQIKTAVADSDGIWVISEKSVNRFSPETELYTLYPGELFMGQYSLSEATPAISDGRIVLATSDGVTYFHPSLMHTDIAPRHHISVTGIRYQNDMDIHPLNDADTINLSADRRSFSLYISPMKFGTEHNTRFRYRIDGYDKGWNYTSEAHPEITYNNLPPGDFTLTVESSAPDGSWQLDSRLIHIYAEPHITETAWFRIIIILLITGAILSTIYAALYFKRMRNEIQKKYSLLMTVDNLSRSYQAVQPAEKSAEGDDEEARRLRFIEQSVSYLNENLDNPQLVVEDLARNAAMSRTAYFNRMKEITGLSPVDFIKQMRIKRAMSLLDDGNLSIADVAYRVGFTDPKYFSRCFKAEMGMTPTQYLDSRKERAALPDELD